MSQDLDFQLPEPLRKRDDETQRAHDALIAYYKLGPGRTIAALVDNFQEIVDNGGVAPSTTYNSLTMWSSKYDWSNRIAEITRQQQAQEIQLMHEKRLEFIEKQLNVLGDWQQQLAMAKPNLEDVKFKDWSLSAERFVAAIQRVFGLDADLTATNVQVNVNERDDTRTESDDKASQKLMDLIDAVSERAELEASGNDEGVIDVEGRPAGSRGKN